MPSYQTIVHDEKSSLLGSEFVRNHPELAAGPIVVEHYLDGPRRVGDLERGYRRRRSGCCARVCWCFFWIIIAFFAFIFFLRRSHIHLDIPSFWRVGSPIDVPVAVTKCPSAPFSYKTGELKYTFDVTASGSPNGFYFGQRWIRKQNAGPSARFIQTAGDVIVQAAPQGSVDPVTVDLEVRLSHEEIADAIIIKQDPAGLVFETATYLDSFTGTDACISVVATISVASFANVSFFDIDTVVLPVELKKSLQFVSNNIFVHSTAGSISSEATSLNSRKIEVETTSNSISGSFPLADFLSIKTVSGPVNVEIEPKETDPEEHAGTLVIRTVSGNIQSNTITSSIPNRNFTSQIHTVSGSVSGTFLLGVVSNVNSASGSIKADFYAAGDVANRSLIVNSVGGSIQSRVFAESYELGTVRSHIQSQTGAVNVQFPAVWEGRIEGKTKTGSIDIVGDGVRIIKDISPIPGFGKIVVAEKGDGYSNLSTETLNAPISVRFG